MRLPGDIAFIDGRLVPATASAIPAFSAAVQQGRGVFTTVAVAAGRSVLAQEHIERICLHAARIGIPIPDRALMTEGLAAVVEANGISRGLVRISLIDTGPAALAANLAGAVSVLVSARAPRILPDAMKLAVSEFPVNSRSPLAGLKTLNYLENHLALAAALRSGFDEAVRLNERGLVVSAVMANLFWSSEGRLFTPPLSAGCLAGTTRGLVIATLGAEEAVADIETLLRADSVFLTSAGVGIRHAHLAEHDPRSEDPVRDRMKRLAEERF